MRGAGCIINDMIDVDIDKNVARTKQRPLASGELDPTSALALLAGILFICLMILFTLPGSVIYMGILVLIPIVLYPIMKQYSFYPQLFLGLVFNIGILMAWFAIKGFSCLCPLAIYFGCVAWTMGYDTIYAFQDIRDDKKQGVGSMAIALGDKSIVVISLLYTLFILLLLFAGFWIKVGYGYYLGIIGAIIHLYYQLFDLDISKPEQCGRKFRSNMYTGIIILLGAILSKFI